METLLKRLNRAYLDYVSYSNGGTRFDFVVGILFNIATYDDSMSEKFAKKIIDVMKAIYTRTTFEYIKDEKNYETFILVANLLDWSNMIEWGSSIRGCWFNAGEEIEFPGLTGKFKMDSEEDYLSLINWFEQSNHNHRVYDMEKIVNDETTIAHMKEIMKMEMLKKLAEHPNEK